MRKLVLTFAIVLGIGFCSFAQNQNGGGLFKYGAVSDEFFNASSREGLLTPSLPQFSESGDQPAPLGSGALLLIGLGAAYALKKKSK